MRKNTQRIPNNNGNRVALYLRTNNSDPKSKMILDNERQHYDNLLHDCPDMESVGIYCDEGYSANAKDRPDFNRMIDDCKAGKIDIIITPNTSRFYRNIVDCIACIRMLRELDHPVGVYFETEFLYTLSDKSDLLLSFMRSLADEESRRRSCIMRRSYELRSKHNNEHK